jgi:hypothetical protein
MPFFTISSPNSGNATQLQGRPVNATAPATGSVLTYNGSSWSAAAGVTGPTGAAGADGSRIYSGSGAPPAGLGFSGDFWIDLAGGFLYGPKASGSWGQGLALQSGPAGATGPVSTTPGPTGATGPASSTTGPTGPASSITGPTGATGRAGATLLAGTGSPPNNYGADGDWYIDLTGADFYGPKLSGVWGAPALDLLAITGPTGPASSVTGPTGPAGAQGTIGAGGSTGPTGAASTMTGPTGSAGAAGSTGPTGAASTITGPTGASGAGGSTGPTGPAGIGSPGSVGATGATGPTGAGGGVGAAGDPGAQGPRGFGAFEYSTDRVGAAQYQAGEIVFYQGAYYICLASNDAITPTSALGVYWNPHTLGATGPAGPTGPAGGGGGGGATLPPGTAAGDILQWDTTGATYTTGPYPLPLAGNSAGYVLTWDAMSSVWYGTAPASSSLPAGSQAGDILTWSAASSTWTTGPYPLPTGASSGDQLIWNGSAWTGSARPSGTLNNGSNAGQILAWDGSTWYATAPGSPLPTGSNQNDLLIWDTMAVAWIATGILPPMRTESTMSYPSTYIWQMSGGVPGWNTPSFYYDGYYHRAQTLPTSDPASSGALWVDSGVLKVSGY